MKKRYIAKEIWTFGVNYYDSAFRCIPDYEVKEIPLVDKKTAETIQEKFSHVIIEEFRH